MNEYKKREKKGLKCYNRKCLLTNYLNWIEGCNNSNTEEMEKSVKKAKTFFFFIMFHLKN